MRKLLALLLSAALLVSLTACSQPKTTTDTPENPETEAQEPAAPAETANKSVTVGLICDGDENDQGYTYNFIRAKEVATESLAAEGIDVNWIVKYNIKENDACTDACIDLAEEDCDMIITIGFGHEEYMLKVAPDYPEIEFINCTNAASSMSALANVHNVFANIYEARYVAGVAGGLKLQQLIDEGTIQPDEAVIGYVAAFAYAEVISGYTSFYLGARSVCPSATMRVKYVNEWSNATEEANAAQALCDAGAKLISQHSDNTTPATTAQANGAFHVGYNNDMTGVAPEASLLSSRIDWSVYMHEAITALVAGEPIAKDWTGGFDTGAVVVTPLNEAIAAPGTAEQLVQTEQALADGSINVFAGPLKGVGFPFIDGDYVETPLELKEGEVFKESDVAGGKTSSPYFCYIIEGITEE